jgi:hypothetical protein
MDVKLTGKHLVTRLGNFSQNRHVSLTQCLHIYLNSVLTTFYIFSVISAFKYVFQVVVLLTLEKKSATSITFLFENLTMDFEFSSPPHTLGHDM